MHSETSTQASRLRIAFIAGRLSRRASGVKVVVEQLSAALNQLGHEVQVFGIADDAWAAGDREAWIGAPAIVLPMIGPMGFGYTPGLTAAVRAFAPDVIHAHGLWMYGSWVAGRLARAGTPDVVSPHGMLDPFALRQGRLKKRLVLAAFEKAHLGTATAVHALNEDEERAVRNFGIRQPVAILPNGVALPPPNIISGTPSWAKRLPEGARVLLFLGRIHPKKNLQNLLKAWEKARCEPWHLVIAGPDQEGHRAALEASHSIPLSKGSVHFVGPQFGPEKEATLNTADAFVLPSFSEGMPMAVLEAWSWRLPVLMSRQCNLPDGFANGCAIDTGTEEETIAVALSKLMRTSKADLDRMGLAGRELVERRYSWLRIAMDFARLYAWCAAGARPSERPAFVRLERKGTPQ